MALTQVRENKGPAGGGGVAERGRGERRDRGRSDKGKNDESGPAARWHEGCSENRRETAKRDRKRRTPKGGRRLAHHTPLLKIPVWWRRAVLPSLPGAPPLACTCSNPEHCAALHALHECTLSCTKVVIVIVLSIARLSTESASLYPLRSVESRRGRCDAETDETSLVVGC